MNKHVMKAKVTVSDISNYDYMDDSDFLAFMASRTVEDPPTATSEGQ